MIIKAMGKIGSKKTRSVPWMELNDALVGNRSKESLRYKTSFKFEKIYHLVDSLTVPGYVNTVVEIRKICVTGENKSLR